MYCVLTVSFETLLFKLTCFTFVLGTLTLLCYWQDLRQRAFLGRPTTVGNSKPLHHPFGNVRRKANLKKALKSGQLATGSLGRVLRGQDRRLRVATCPRLPAQGWGLGQQCFRVVRQYIAAALEVPWSMPALESFWVW